MNECQIDPPMCMLTQGSSISLCINHPSLVGNPQVKVGRYIVLSFWRLRLHTTHKRKQPRIRPLIYTLRHAERCLSRLKWGWLLNTFARTIWLLYRNPLLKSWIRHYYIYFESQIWLCNWQQNYSLKHWSTINGRKKLCNCHSWVCYTKHISFGTHYLRHLSGTHHSLAIILLLLKLRACFTCCAIR